MRAYYAARPFGYSVTDGFQTATKIGPNTWHVEGDFHGDNPREVRTFNDDDMLETFGQPESAGVTA